MKKKTKNIIILSSVILLILAIGYLGVKQSLVYTGPVSPPSHIYAGGSNRYACNVYPDYKYNYIVDGVYGDYAIKYNVAVLETREQYSSFENNKVFYFDITERYGSTPVGTTIVSLEDGLPAQKKCDGTYDCLYGFTKEQWELRGDKCYVIKPKITVFRFLDNSCSQIEIKEDEKTNNDYNTLLECQGEIIEEIPEEVIEEIPEEVIEETPETPEKPDDNVVENPDNPEELVVECTSNIECLDECGNQIPTCIKGFCECDGLRITTKKEETNFLFYVIPISFIILVALIIWARRKKPKRRRK